MANFLLGNFTGLFEVGIALNLSYALFSQVREAGLKHLSDELEDIWKQVKISKEDAAYIDDSGLDSSRKIINEKIERFNKDIVDQSAVYIWWTLFFAACCGILLFVCSLEGEKHLEISSFWGVSFLLSSLGLTVLPMPILVFCLFWRLRKKQKELKDQAKAHVDLMKENMEAVKKKYKNQVS